MALARDKADDAKLDELRVERAKVRLTETLATRFDEEVEAARLAAYQEADADAERVAQRLRDEWDELAGHIENLLRDQMRSNDLVDAANRDLPDGKQPLNRAEGRAANFFDQGTYETPASRFRFRTPKAIIGDLAGNVVWPPDQDFELDLMRKKKTFSMQAIWWLWTQKREGRLKHRRKSLD